MAAVRSDSQIDLNLATLKISRERGATVEEDALNKQYRPGVELVPARPCSSGSATGNRDYGTGRSSRSNFEASTSLVFRLKVTIRNEFVPSPARTDRISNSGISNLEIPALDRATYPMRCPSWLVSERLVHMVTVRIIRSTLEQVTRAGAKSSFLCERPLTSRASDF